MTEITKRIIKLMEQEGNTPRNLELKAQLSLSSINHWKNDISQPSTDSIKKLAEYFNVSADYLLCLSDAPTPLKISDIAERQIAALSTEITELAQDERFIDCTKMYKALPDEKRDRFYGLVQGIIVGLGLNIQQILGK